MVYSNLNLMNQFYQIFLVILLRLAVLGTSRYDRSLKAWTAQDEASLSADGKMAALHKVSRAFLNKYRSIEALQASFSGHVIQSVPQ